MPILTYEEYSKIKHPTPYFFTIHNNKKFLYYSGEKHSFNPEDEQWIKVGDFWDDFISKTNGTKRIVFVEGGLPTIKETKEEAIRQSGGTGYLIFLASKSAIQTYCPEPSRNIEMNSLAKKFSKEEVEYYYFARIVAQWWRRNEDVSKFEQYIQVYLERDKEMSGWSDFDFSLTNMKKIHSTLFGSDFDLNDRNFFQKIITPVELVTVVNRVARNSSNFRNEYVVNEISKYWKDGYSIFIEYGASHAVTLEQYLRDILNVAG